MKYLNKISVLVLVAVVLMAGCNTDTLQDLNINPQAVDQIDLNYLFSEASLGIASNGSSGDNRYTDWRTNIGMGSGAIQQRAFTGGIGNIGDKYGDNSETNAAPFEFTSNDQLKNISQVEHSRHRSFNNFVVNLLAGLVAYTHQPKKPSLNLSDDDLMALSLAS